MDEANELSSGESKGNDKIIENLHINVYVTHDCNRSCAFCYYPRSVTPMDTGLAIDVGNWIHNLVTIENVKFLRVHFLGGETFKNLNAIKILTTMLMGIQGPPEGKYVVFSNGDYFKDDTLKDLKRRKVRILLNPTDDPINVVEEKILKVKNMMGGCSLAICLDNINLERLPELTKLALKHHCHMRVNRLYSGGIIPGYVDLFEAKMSIMFDILIASEWTMWPNMIMETTTPLWEGEKNPNFCGKYFLVIDPDGSIRSCNADIETKIGHITTHSKLSDFKFTHRWSAKNLPECKGCEWINVCQGGCPLTRKLTHGTYEKRTPFCRAFKVLFPKLEELKNKWKTKEQ